jgi:hypothetical protein
MFTGREKKMEGKMDGVVQILSILWPAFFLM